MIKKQIAVIALVSGMLLGSMLLPLTGCANRGIGPQGGPVDSMAPVVTKMNVPNGARNVQAKEMKIQFNEFIQINGSTDNILVSPPQQRPPQIVAVGKRVEIQFQEDLTDSTTYTIDFGDQIVDITEKNPVKNYAYCFSTGDRIDSLEVYGQLINAEDLNPVSGVVIGLHRNMHDSALSTIPFNHIARTNEDGEFVIRNVKEGTYRLYGLGDVSRDYLFQAGEGLAFMDERVTPYIISEVVQDTIFLPDTLNEAGQPVPDSVITAEYFYFEPHDLLLRYFIEDYQRLYFQRALRKEANQIQLYFNGPQPAIPSFTALRLESDSLGTDSTWVDFTKHCLIQHSAHLDTFTLWLVDSLAIRMDSIRFAMNYVKTDSLYQLQSQTDTVLTVYRAPHINERTRKSMQEKRLKMGLQLTCTGTRSFNHFDTLLLRSKTPIAFYCKDSMHLYLQEDTLLTPVPFSICKADSAGLSLKIMAEWHPGSAYKLELDSAAVCDHYNLVSNANKYTIKVRKLDEYATITVHVEPYMENAYIQILNGQDQPVRTVHAEQRGTIFQFLEPGTYYMRLFLDENKDGLWTTGDWKTHRQPEKVYYFSKKLNLRANWEFEEHFDWQAIPLLQQKPAAIRKDLGSQKK